MHTVHKLVGDRDSQADNPPDSLPSEIRQLIHEKSCCVLDIDLDFYSTLNPFLDMYPKIDLYKRLKNIYVFDPVPSHLQREVGLADGSDSREKWAYAMRSRAERAELLSKLEDITNHLNENKNLVAYSGIGEEFSSQFDTIRKDIKGNFSAVSGVLGRGI